MTPQSLDPHENPWKRGDVCTKGFEKVGFVVSYTSGYLEILWPNGIERVPADEVDDILTEPRGDGGVSDKTRWEGRDQQLGARIRIVWTLFRALGSAKENICALESLKGYIVSGCWEIKRKFRVLCREYHTDHAVQRILVGQLAVGDTSLGRRSDSWGSRLRRN